MWGICVFAWFFPSTKPPRKSKGCFFFTPFWIFHPLPRFWLLNRRSDCRVCLPPPELKGSRGAGQGFTSRMASKHLGVERYLDPPKTPTRSVSAEKVFGRVCLFFFGRWIGWPMTNCFLNSTYYPHIHPKMVWIWSLGPILLFSWDWSAYHWVQ